MIKDEVEENFADFPVIESHLRVCVCVFVCMYVMRV